MRSICALIAGLLFLVPLDMRSVTPETRSDSIRTALIYQRSYYPASQYRDVYKIFMQDYFGPGHILNDTVAAKKYLQYELSNFEEFGGPDFEPTGFQGNFYRVNLRHVISGRVPYDVFFESFVKSVQGIVPPDSVTWMNVWQEIDDEISAIGWTFENEEQDRKDLSEQFKKGEFIAHHSKAFNEANKFHYRIFSRKIFFDVIKPLLDSQF